MFSLEDVRPAGQKEEGKGTGAEEAQGGEEEFQVGDEGEDTGRRRVELK